MSPASLVASSLLAAALAITSAVDGYLFRPAEGGRHPALVFLHGCGGLLTRSGEIVARERAWAERFVADGYVVLMADSFSRRGIREMCAPATFRLNVYRDRTDDALAALRYLRMQSNVDPNRIGLVGWSEGGGVVLRTIRGTTGFRAAVAFYPASCNARILGARWRAAVPLLVLVGDGDVWTPAKPCAAVLAGARGGAPVTLQRYPGAYHDFDWPNDPVHRLPAYRTSSGIVPIAGTDPVARADSLERVSAFLRDALGR